MASYNLSELVSVVHRIDAVFDGKRFECSVRGHQEITLVPVVGFFVRHVPDPLPLPPPATGDEYTREEFENILRLERVAIRKEIVRVVKKALASKWGAFSGAEWTALSSPWVPIAELRAFLLDTVREKRDLDYIRSFPFDTLADAARQSWNAHVEKEKQVVSMMLESRKRRLDTLLVDAKQVDKERPWKRQRKADEEADA